MTYEEAIEENPSITRAAAERECTKHSAKFEEMLIALGDRDEYQARDVLFWLGY